MEGTKCSRRRAKIYDGEGAMAAGKELEGNRMQDQNIRSGKSKSRNFFLSVRRAMVKEGEICTFLLTTSNLKPPFFLMVPVAQKT